ncbi:FTR1 family protein [Paractinoplanes durhamensis]|uniref:FTR1 family protein n=1 Tax=Paractinoplanes durhamensis TaxID=113563 RepID=UPI00363DE738
MFATAVRINLSVFFKWTGVLLILVAAGIFKYGVHSLQEAEFLPGIGNMAYDAASFLDPSTWYATLLAGMFNITPQPSVLEIVAWVLYLIPALVFSSGRPASRSRPNPPPHRRDTCAAPFDSRAGHGQRRRRLWRQVG